MAGAVAAKKKPNRTTNARSRQTSTNSKNGSAPVAALNRQQQDIQFRSRYGQLVAEDLGRLAGIVTDPQQQAGILERANATAEWCGLETRFTTAAHLKTMTASAGSGGGSG